VAAGPARFVSAAGGGHGGHPDSASSDGAELRLAERSRSPHLRLPPEDVLVSRLKTGYVVVDATGPAPSSRTYPARRPAGAPGASGKATGRQITYAWPELAPLMTSWRAWGP